MGGDAEIGEGLDEDAFEGVDVGGDGEVVVGEAEDGIGDELAGAVEGDVAAAVGFDEVDAELVQLGSGGEEVMGGAAPAKGNDGGVLEEEETFRAAGEDVGVGLFLDGPGVAVGEGAEVLEEHGH